MGKFEDKGFDVGTKDCVKRQQLTQKQT